MLDAEPGRLRSRDRGAAAARLAAVRRDAAPLRHDRPGRPADDAAGPRRPRCAWTGGRAGRARAVAGAAPRRAVPRRGLRRSAGPGSRLATWLAVDPDRTAFDDRLLRGDDPVAAYADFAAGAARSSAAGERAPDHAVPAGAAARALPRGALPRRAARRAASAGVVGRPHRAAVRRRRPPPGAALLARDAAGSASTGTARRTAASTSSTAAASSSP